MAGPHLPRVRLRDELRRPRRAGGVTASGAGAAPWAVGRKGVRAGRPEALGKREQDVKTGVGGGGGRKRRSCGRPAEKGAFRPSGPISAGAVPAGGARAGAAGRARSRAGCGRAPGRHGRRRRGTGPRATSRRAPWRSTRPAGSRPPCRPPGAGTGGPAGAPGRRARAAIPPRPPRRAGRAGRAGTTCSPGPGRRGCRATAWLRRGGARG
jgi:hypothetical protein